MVTISLCVTTKFRFWEWLPNRPMRKCLLGCPCRLLSCRHFGARNGSRIEAAGNQDYVLARGRASRNCRTTCTCKGNFGKFRKVQATFAIKFWPLILISIFNKWQSSIFSGMKPLSYKSYEDYNYNGQTRMYR